MKDKEKVEGNIKRLIEGSDDKLQVEKETYVVQYVKSAIFLNIYCWL